jgi:ATP-binding cassette, subfamily B, bacterial
MTMPGGHGNWAMMRSFSRDQEVARQRLRPDTLRRIVRFASEYRRWLLVLLVLIVVDSAIGASTPWFAKLIVQAIQRHQAGTVEVLAGILAGLAVVDAGIGLANRWYSARIGEGLIYDMRSAVFSHIQRMPIAFFTRTQTGALISRINSDVLGAQQAFTGTLSNVVSNVVTVTLVLGAMFFLSWQVTLLSLLLLPLFIIPARFMGRRLAGITLESYNLNARMSATMTERFNVAGALLVKLFGRGEEEDSRFRRRARRVADIGVQQAMYSRIFLVTLTLVAALATAVVYAYEGARAANNPALLPTVVALVAYLGRLYGPLTALSNVQVDVMTALVSFERVFEVLDLEPAITDRPGADVLPRDLAQRATIEFDHVEFRYPTPQEVSLASLEAVAVLDHATERQVLYDVSFRAEPGELVALVGPSGAGKTTMSQLVPRMYDVQGGAVRVAGHDVRDVTLASLRSAVGVVTQDAHMFHDTIRANLLYAQPDATDDALWAAIEAAQIGELVRALPEGLDTLVGERGYRLSGGEKQRLAIARLLLKEPAIVILDEATAHLDSESEGAIQRALAIALSGRTSLVIAHRLSTVREADQILVIEEGRIVERGKHDDLLATGGLYAELYRTQFERQATAGAIAEQPVAAD